MVISDIPERVCICAGCRAVHTIQCGSGVLWHSTGYQVIVLLVDVTIVQNHTVLILAALRHGGLPEKDGNTHCKVKMYMYIPEEETTGLIVYRYVWVNYTN